MEPLLRYQKTVKEALYTSGVVLVAGSKLSACEPEVLISSIGAAGIAMSIGVFGCASATVGKQISIVGVGTLVLLRL